MADVPNRSDSQLVLSALRGDVTAFNVLVERYNGPVAAIIHAYGLPHDDVADIAQETWLRAYAGLATLKEPNRFGFWVMGICRNVCKQSMKKRRRNALLMQEYQEYIARRPKPELSENGDLERAIEQLQEPYRLIILMRFFACREAGREMRISDIATALQCHRQTVAKLLNRGLRRLRNEQCPYEKSEM